MAISTLSRPHQGLSIRLVPSVTGNSNASRLAPATTRVDVNYLLNQDTTPESELGFGSAGHWQPKYAPIAPPSQSSPTGARFGRTPLPNAPPASLTGSTSGVTPSGLDYLAIAAVYKAQSQKRRARAPGGLRKHIEHVMTQQDRPMSATEVHRAVIALTRQDYKYQSVRKALSDPEAPFEPQRKSKWVLKSWGLAPSRIKRRFGTGGGTMEARQRRAKAA